MPQPKYDEDFKKNIVALSEGRRPYTSRGVLIKLDKIGFKFKLKQSLLTSLKLSNTNCKSYKNLCLK